MGVGNDKVSPTPLAQLWRGFAMLGLAEIAARLVAFGATAWVSQHLGAGPFGVVSFALAALLYANRVVSWELESVGVTEVVPRDEHGDAAAGTIIAARFLSAIVAIVVLGGLARWVLPSPDGVVLVLYAIGLAAVALNTRFAYLMRGTPARPALARFLAESVNAAVVLVLVRSAADVERVPFGFVIGEAIAAAFLLSAIPGAWRGVRRFDAGLARHTMRRAAPLVLASLLGLIAFNLDLILLRLTRGSESAGFYAAAYALVALVLNLGVTYAANVLPGLSRLRDDRDAFGRLYSDANLLLFVLMVPCVVGGAVLARPLVNLVFGAEYASSAAPLAPLLVAAGLTLSRLVPVAAIVALGRRREALWVNGSGAVVNVALNLILIPRFGIMGAASSAVATDIVRLVVAQALVRRAGVEARYARRLVAPASAAAVMGVLVWLVRAWPVPLAVVSGAAIYGAALVMFGVVKIGPGARVRLAEDA
ncbi:MAG: polysaccharide biosynthesis C-terminal domain-containing protein [Gemmatimonadaceae bacterium]|nr:polysaccharide biosynthesis C-terminal domain-containing protein [Gemmatimonadaceae bacterium]